MDAHRADQRGAFAAALDDKLAIEIEPRNASQSEDSDFIPREPRNANTAEYFQNCVALPVIDTVTEPFLEKAIDAALTARTRTQNLLHEAIEARISNLESRLSGNEEKWAVVDSMAQSLSKLLEQLDAKTEVVEAEVSHVASRAKHLSTNSTQSMYQEDVRDRYQYYDFKYSMWDALALVGTNPIGWPSSVLVLLLIVLQLGVTSIFCYLTVHDEFTADDFKTDSLQALGQWRHMIGHSPQNVKEILGEGVGLLSRICAEDRSVGIGAEKVEMLDEIRAFVAIGWIICLLAISVWWLVILKEFNECLTLLCTSWCLPSSDCTRVLRIQAAGALYVRNLELESLSMSRKMFITFVFLIRCSLLAFLSVSGALWLLHTTKIEDFLLNAVSLEIVLHLDELVFHALGPKHAHDVLAKLRPLKGPELPQWRSLDIWALIKLFTFICLLVAGAAVVSEQSDWLHSFDCTLCAGVQNFAYEVDAGGLVTWMHTKTYDRTRLDQRVFDAVTQLIDRGFSELLVVNVPADQQLSLNPGETYKEFLQNSPKRKEMSTEIWRDVMYERLTGYFGQGCVDQPPNWRDIHGYTCKDYNTSGFCYDDGSYGEGWDGGLFASKALAPGLGADQACCSCGGGFRGDLLRDMDDVGFRLSNNYNSGSFPLVISMWLGDQLEATSRRSCTDFADSCGSRDPVGILARWLCPNTCGCANLTTGPPLLSGANDGCHKSTRARYTALLQFKWFFPVHRKPCSDTSDQWVDPSWKEVLLRLHPSRNSITNLPACAVLEQLPSEKKSMFCNRNPLTHKSWIFICPTACGCQGRIEAYCPSQCNEGFSPVILSAVFNIERISGRGVQIFLREDVHNLSEYELGVGSGSVEIPTYRFINGFFPAGTVLNVVTPTETAFQALYPNSSLIVHAGWNANTMVSEWGGFNSIVLFRNSVVVDRYGAEGQSGAGRPWQYEQAVAYRLYNWSRVPFYMMDWSIKKEYVHDCSPERGWLASSAIACEDHTSCDLVCGCGYRYTSFRLGGPSERITFPHTLQSCKEACNLRSYCTSFSFNHDGNSNYNCKTYTRGDVNMLATSNSAVWVSCIRNDAIPAPLDVCVTVGSTGVGVGHSCRFPFEFQGQRYNGCTNHNATDPSYWWCATEGGQMSNSLSASAGQYGQCSPVCSKAHCFHWQAYFDPPMIGQGVSHEFSSSTCQQRCAEVSGCAHFSYQNNECFLSDRNSSYTYAWWTYYVSGPPTGCV